MEREAAHDTLNLTALAVALALNDLPREDDVFEIENREVVIFKFFGGMDRNDIVERANKIADLADDRFCHSQMLSELSVGV